MRTRNYLPRPIRTLSLAIFLLVLAALALGQQGAPQSFTCTQCPEWNKQQQPFRIYGNTYYVGPH